MYLFQWNLYPLTINNFAVLILDPNIYIQLEAMKTLSQELKKALMHLVSSTPRLKFLDVGTKQETGNTKDKTILKILSLHKNNIDIFYF